MGRAQVRGQANAGRLFYKSNKVSIAYDSKIPLRDFLETGIRLVRISPR